MALDTDKIDDATLALLYLALHDGCRAWKGMDWDVLDRLCEGYGSAMGFATARPHPTN